MLGEIIIRLILRIRALKARLKARASLKTNKDVESIIADTATIGATQSLATETASTAATTVADQVAIVDYAGTAAEQADKIEKVANASATTTTLPPHIPPTVITEKEVDVADTSEVPNVALARQVTQLSEQVAVLQKTVTTLNEKVETAPQEGKTAEAVDNKEVENVVVVTIQGKPNEEEEQAKDDEPAAAAELESAGEEPRVEEPNESPPKEEVP